MLKYVSIMALLIGSCGLGADKSGGALVLHIEGNNFGDAINDECIIGPSGKVTLKTIGMFLLSAPDTEPIGTFAADLPKSYFKKMVGLVKKIENKNKGVFNLPPDSYAASLRWEKDEKPFAQWLVPGDIKKTEGAIEKLYSEIRTKLLEHPQAALQLTCKKEKGQFSCFIKNIGTRDVKTADPLQMFDSISCLDQKFMRHSLNDQGESDFGKLAPKTIMLKPGTSHSFSMNYKEPCVRIMVRTSDMLMTEKYADYLLGSLVSNKLD